VPGVSATTLSGGALSVGSNTTLGTGGLLFNAASTALWADGGSRTLANSVTYTTNTAVLGGRRGYGGTNRLPLTRPAPNTRPPAHIEVAPPLPAVTISGTIGENGLGRNVTKTGFGTLTLSGNNYYSGQLSVSAGVVNVTTATAFGQSTGTLASGTNVASGAA